MKEIIILIAQNYHLVFLVSLFLVICFYILLHYYKLKRMFDIDSYYEKRDENGNILQKGYTRNIWDLSICPPLSSLFFRKDWKIAVAVYLFVLFLALYIITKEQWLAELIKVNFGLIIGALIDKKAEKQSQNSPE